MRKLALVFLLLVSLLAPAALAFATHDTVVIIPIIGRFAGVPPSLWRTDVFIANPFSPTNVFTMNFYRTGQPVLTRTVTIGPYSAVSLRDVVLTMFGLDVAAGQLELKSATGVEARARIYNQGLSIGEFGQNVLGLGLYLLSWQGFLHGLSGINGNRMNVGVPNPNDVVVNGTLRITDKDNNALASTAVTLQPHETQQFNDIFTRFSITPQADVQVEFNTFELRVYLYASEVRNDWGDAIFVAGTSPNS